MNINVLKGFISRLDFVSERTKKSFNNNYEINILDVDDNLKRVKGKLVIKLGDDGEERISFETHFSQSEDILVFKSTYQSESLQFKDEELTMSGEKVFECVDTFAIVNQEQKSFFTPKTKYLIHLVDGMIKQAYIVNKKYTFANGISENYTKMNMNNREVFNSIQSTYEVQNTGKKKK